jgi:hypothetical protein
MTVADYIMIMQQGARLDVYQVALGSGNPNQQPEFVDILRITRQDFGIVANYATNGRGLTDDVLEATARFCGAALEVSDPNYDLCSYGTAELSTTSKFDRIMPSTSPLGS